MIRGRFSESARRAALLGKNPRALREDEEDIEIEADAGYEDQDTEDLKSNIIALVQSATAEGILTAEDVYKATENAEEDEGEESLEEEEDESLEESKKIRARKARVLEAKNRVARARRIAEARARIARKRNLQENRSKNPAQGANAKALRERALRVARARRIAEARKRIAARRSK